MRKIFIVALSLTCIICAGCFKGEFDLTVTDEGAVIRTWKILGTAPFARQIEEWCAETKLHYPNLRVKPISEGDLLGYEFALDYPDLETFARVDSEFYSAQAGKNRGISRKARWFFDEYDFDFYFDSLPDDLPPEAAHLTQVAFEGVVYDVRVRLPYSAERTDADEVLSGGKVLTWHLAPILIHGGERHMCAGFRLWHADKLALTALIEVLLLAAMLFFSWKVRTEESAELARDLRFKRNVFAGLSLALALVAAYLLLAPVTFASADTISVVTP